MFLPRHIEDNELPHTVATPLPVEVPRVVALQPVKTPTDEQRRRMLAVLLLKRDGVGNKDDRSALVTAFLENPIAFAKRHRISLAPHIQRVIAYHKKTGKPIYSTARLWKPTADEASLLTGLTYSQALSRRRKTRRASPLERAENDAANAMLTKDEFATANVRDTFVQRLPVKVLSGNDHKLDKTYRRRADAITKRYIALNDDTEIRWMPFDMDKPKDYVGEWDVRTHWRDVGAPEPNVIVVNPATGNGKYLFALAKPITTLQNNGRSHPVAWFLAIRRGLTKRLQADLGYNGGTCRNPLYDGHEAVWSDAPAYTLKDLACDLTKDEMARVQRKTHGQGGTGVGRNATMFDALCEHGYFGRLTQFKTNGGTEDEWRVVLASAADEINGEFAADYAGALPDDEVEAMVDRVAVWHWHKYKPKRKVENQAKAGRVRGAKRRDEIEAVVASTEEAPRSTRIDKVMSDLGVSKERARRLTAKPRAKSALKQALAMGISRATYFRDQKAGRLATRKPIKVTGNDTVTEM